MHVAAAAAFPYTPSFASVNPHAMAAAAMAAAAVSSPMVTQPTMRRVDSLSSGGRTAEEGRGMKRSSLTPTLSSGSEGEKMSMLPKVAKRKAMTPRSESAGKLEACKIEKKERICTGVGGGSPNFANIYAFFAKMFDPAVEFDAIEGVRDEGMSPLDKEVIKLLMSNLEFNIANTTFRQQLLDTYQQQLRRGSQQTVV